MNCPICSQPTRIQRTEGRERRRECTACGHRFTTREILKDEHQRQEQIIKDAKALAEQISGAV